MNIYVESRARLLAASAILLSIFVIGGCSVGTQLWNGSGSASVRVTNQATERFIEPELTAVAYSHPDTTGADIFLTNLPLDRLADPNDALGGLVGSLVHVHLFLVPSAGDTPISRTACNVTVRMLVLADGAGSADIASDGGFGGRIGLYSGGGFVLPSGSPGDGSYGGSMFGASMRLAASSSGFVDPLSPAEMTGSFRAPLKPDMAQALMARLNRTSDSLAVEGRASSARR